MTEYLTSLVVTAVGAIVIAFATVLLSTRGGAKRIRWRGFGVTFEISPCDQCVKRATKPLR